MTDNNQNPDEATEIVIPLDDEELDWLSQYLQQQEDS